MSKLNIYEDLKPEKVAEIKLHVENNANVIEDIINSIVAPYTRDLDDYVEFIDERLTDQQKQPTDRELEDFCMNLSTLIYFAGGMCEQLGVRDDISRAIYKEMYHSTRNDLSSGTVADKDSLAELGSQQEYLTNVCYSRAYKIVKAKVSNAQELLTSCKKVLSHRMQEQELTRIGG